MISLEKNMYLLPNRFFLRDNDKLFVSFNLSSVPQDMVITAMQINIPTQLTAAAALQIFKILDGWDVGAMAVGHVPPVELMKTTDIPEQTREFQVEVLQFAIPWRLDSFNNHGICILVPHLLVPALFSESAPPSLVITTV